MHKIINNKKELVDYVEALISGDSKLISILANVSSLLINCIDGTSWAGFYLYDSSDNSLYLGPFQGDIACEYIPYGKGVCGTCLKNKQTQLIEDVSTCENHIACSELTKSELVVPIIKDNEVVAVIDLDSYNLNNFTMEDCKILQEVAYKLSKIF